MMALVKETVSLQDLLRSNRTLKIAATNWVSGDEQFLDQMIRCSGRRRIISRCAIRIIHRRRERR
jgi:hypothetical protein